jgi:membrane-bound serine protease (ClpP class)
MDNLIVVLTISALFLILIEIFLVPGVGVVGILGTICLIAATYLASRDHGMLAASGIFLGVGGLCVLAFVLFFRSPASQVLVHSQNLDTGSNDEAVVEVGGTGTTKTDLRPSGKAHFVIKGREQQMDVVTGGEFILKDREIKVVRIEGNRIIVEEKV